MDGKQTHGGPISNGIQTGIGARRIIRSVSLMLLAFFLLMAVSACSGSANNSNFEAKGNAEAPMAKDQFGDATTLEGTEALAAGEAGEKSVSQDSTAADEAVNGTRGGSGIGPIADANAGFDRKVIYRANLVMKVEEFTKAEEELQNLIHISEAYILQFSDSQNTNEVGAAYVIKVPSEGFTPFLEKLQGIKTLKLERKVEGNDVTEEFVDLESRLKAKLAVEARLLAFMDKATRSDDLIQFSNQLASVQEEIETIKGRMRYLDQNVAFSTINLRLYQTSGIPSLSEDEESKTFTDKLSDALSGSTKVLRQFGEGLLIVVAAMLPVLLVLAIIGVPAYFLYRSRQKNRRKPEIEPISDPIKPSDIEEDR
jgi:regulator of replication initiation timing